LIHEGRSMRCATFERPAVLISDSHRLMTDYGQRRCSSSCQPADCSNGAHIFLDTQTYVSIRTFVAIL
jgi:hypothetical protein